MCGQGGETRAERHNSKPVVSKDAELKGQFSHVQPLVDRYVVQGTWLIVAWATGTSVRGFSDAQASLRVDSSPRSIDLLLGYHGNFKLPHKSLRLILNLWTTKSRFQRGTGL